jgi:hypothetical protein
LQQHLSTVAASLAFLRLFETDWASMLLQIAAARDAKCAHTHSKLNFIEQLIKPDLRHKQSKKIIKKINLVSGKPGLVVKLAKNLNCRRLWQPKTNLKKERVASRGNHFRLYS